MFACFLLSISSALFGIVTISLWAWFVGTVLEPWVRTYVEKKYDVKIAYKHGSSLWKWQILTKVSVEKSLRIDAYLFLVIFLGFLGMLVPLLITISIYALLQPILCA